MTKKRISIFYAWGSTNAGDHALTLGAISLVRQVCEDAEITVVTRYGTDEEEHITTTQKLREFDSELTICPNPFRGSSQSSIGKLRRIFSGATQSALSLIAPSVSRFVFKNSPAYQAMIHCDWALQNGGNLYYWNSSRKAISRLAAFALPLRIAKSAGNKVGFLPQTIGSLEGTIGNWFAEFIASADFVLFRDSSSKKNLSNASSCTSKTMTVPDLVYFMPAQPPELATSSLEFPAEFIAITLRDESLGDYGVADYEEDRAATRKRILELFLAALTIVKRDFDLPIVIVIQVMRDAEVSHLLADLLVEHGFSATVVECYDPLTLISFYASAKILIAQRLHSQIFALNSGTPSVALWRQRLGTKIPSMMSDLECSDYCLDFDKTDAESVGRATCDLLKNLENVSERCKSLLSQRKQETIEFLRTQLDE